MIEIHQITKVFQEKIALEKVSFDIPKGMVFGIIGPNGAGKTTLIRILNQILSSNEGYVKYNGTLLNEAHVRSFGYLPEERGLYREMRVMDQLVFLGELRGLSRKEAGEKALKWLAKFEIQDWSKRRIDSLSKGMAQKIQFISSVLHDPEVIILDEPLSGFDPLNINLILTEIETFKNAGKSVIFSTHNMDSVDSICDEVALIHAGKVIAKDRVANLRSQHKNGDYKIRYRGNVIAFANALWTSFEIIESKEIGDDLREAVIRRRGNETFNDVFNALSSALDLTLIEEKLPGMQDVFVNVIEEHNHHEE